MNKKQYEKYQQIIEARNNYLSYEQISKKLKVSKSTIKKYIDLNEEGKDLKKIKDEEKIYADFSFVPADIHKSYSDLYENYLEKNDEQTKKLYSKATFKKAFYKYRSHFTKNPARLYIRKLFSNEDLKKLENRSIYKNYYILAYFLDLEDQGIYFYGLVNKLYGDRTIAFLKSVFNLLGGVYPALEIYEDDLTLGNRGTSPRQRKYPLEVIDKMNLEEYLDFQGLYFSYKKYKSEENTFLENIRKDIFIHLKLREILKDFTKKEVDLLEKNKTLKNEEIYEKDPILAEFSKNLKKISINLSEKEKARLSYKLSVLDQENLIFLMKNLSKKHINYPFKVNEIRNISKKDLDFIKRNLINDKNFILHIKKHHAQRRDYKKVSPRNSHIKVKGNYYSLPISYRGKYVLVKYGAKYVNIYKESSKKVLIVSHPIFPPFEKNKYRTKSSHFQRKDQLTKEKNPAFPFKNKEDYIKEASQIGVFTKKIIENLFKENKNYHESNFYLPAYLILKFKNIYSIAEMEEASRIFLEEGKEIQYVDYKNMLEKVRKEKDDR
jgi:hypothetical protein